MGSKCHLVYLSIIGLLCIVIAWQWGRGALSSIHLSFADDQTDEFVRTVDAAAESLAKSPPGPRTEEAWIEHLEAYYPSGTKQVKGSRLDTITERARSLAKRCIVEMVRCAQEKSEQKLQDDE